MSAPSQPKPRIGLLLCDDMIFTSRITGTARDLGLCVKPARSVAALDALTRDEMQRLLAEVWRETRKTVVYVTHNVAEAVYLADRVVVMTPHPGTVKTEVQIALARPRDPLSVEFLEHQKMLLRNLGQETPTSSQSNAGKMNGEAGAMRTTQ